MWRGMRLLLAHWLPVRRQSAAVRPLAEAIACRDGGDVVTRMTTPCHGGPSGPIPPRPAARAPARSAGSSRTTWRPVVGRAAVADHWPTQPRWRWPRLLRVPDSPMPKSRVLVPRTRMSGAWAFRQRRQQAPPAPLSETGGTHSSPGGTGGPQAPERKVRLVPDGEAPPPLDGARALLSLAGVVVVAGLPSGAPAVPCTSAGRRGPARRGAGMAEHGGHVAPPARRAAPASSQMSLVRPSA